ncbi:MAG: CRTAC1 family protein [Acidobacteriota bacterium]
MRRSARLAVISPRRLPSRTFVALVLALLSGCAPSVERSPETKEAVGPGPSAPYDAEVARAESEPLFSERAAEVGLAFTHFNGMTGDFVYSEIFAGGTALFDYDGDGDLDVYVTQGRMIDPAKSLADARQEGFTERPVDRLFRNVMRAGAPESLRFEDVTEQAGLRNDRDSMGVAAGDYDGDGHVDLYVTDLGGRNTLLRNRGDGTFEDATARAGAGDSRWSLAAAFLDYDRDGWLDLYVSNYVEFSFSLNKTCVNDVSMRDYCGPTAFVPAADGLLRNSGDGTFRDVTGSAKSLQPSAPSLGLVTGDFDDNGWIDLYIANDGYPNNLLLNQGDGTFRDEARVSGAAMSGEGHAEAGMGITAGDFDRDGDEDLFLAHLNQETNTLYQAEPGALFSDRTAMLGLGPSSFDFTGFGAGFLDVDNDGFLDLLVVNGAVQTVREQVTAGDFHPLHQKNLVWLSEGGGRFREASARGGAAFEASHASRGAAFGDLDNDGDTDVVVHNNAGPLRFLRNEVGQLSAWVGIRAVGPSGRDMLGTRVDLESPGARQMRRIRTEGSYASANDPRALFGLGENASGPITVLLTWPDGTRERWRDLEPRAYHRLVQGEGEAL